MYFSGVSEDRHEMAMRILESCYEIKCNVIETHRSKMESLYMIVLPTSKSLQMNYKNYKNIIKILFK